jgi:hypothetical protein
MSDFSMYCHSPSGFAVGRDGMGSPLAAGLDVARGD